MTCERLDDIAELYVSSDLATEVLSEVEAHLMGCAACRERVQAARSQLRALEAALALHRATDGFVGRTMRRVRAEAAPVEVQAEGHEPWRSRILRYAALAAAAALLVMAGHGFLRRGSMGWLESGTAAVIGPSARRLEPNAALAPGDVLATPAGRGATLALAAGRLRVVLAPRTMVRITDPRSGTALQLLRGEVYCRGSSTESTPLVASPLANVAAGPGVVSLHVTPEPAAAGSAGGARPFKGMVTLAAHDGAARVVVPGRRLGAVPLGRGQVLTLSTDQRLSLPAPVHFDRLREILDAERRKIRTRHGELELGWDTLIMGGPGPGAPGERAQVFRRASELQEALSQTRAVQAELERRLKLLERCQAEGRRAFRVVVRPVPR